MINEIIPEASIQEAKNRNACNEAISWLKEKPRTWLELARFNGTYIYWGEDLVPKKVLEKLAKDKDSEVRCGVANNPNTSTKVLEELAKDKDWCVRDGVASNPTTPV